MKIIAKRRLYNDLLICAGFVCLIIITPPISLKNPSTIMSFISILFLLIFEILPHLRVIELTQDKDWFMTLLDLKDYIKVKDQVFADYEDRNAWAKKMLVNIGEAGFFSSDRTIEQYNKDIWHLN